MYRVVWHEGQSEILSEAAYPTIREAARAAKAVLECYCACCRPRGYDVVFAQNGRIVPDWLRHLELERVN